MIVYCVSRDIVCQGIKLGVNNTNPRIIITYEEVRLWYMMERGKNYGGERKKEVGKNTREGQREDYFKI